MRLFGIIKTEVFLAGIVGFGALVGCGAVHQAAGNGAPTDVRWVDFQGVQLPVADEGPRHIEGPIATGYDASPAGAALAAIESTVRMSVATDTQWPKVGQVLIAAGQGRDRWATARAQLSITEPIAPGCAPEVLGYTIADFTPKRAGVAIYARQADGSLTRNLAGVTRRDDNWLLDLAADPKSSVLSAVTSVPPDMVILRGKESR
ncbi:hypothetical protein [Nocardia arthritidis]|uniref:DUF8175 domain-containing protein n=1 Tax=Nocardia arthritidis TaxID=228602 RepID=A0A6G9Y6C1_9NOCA|nr:hypothetical protein [Nocardia arthritidis]QIS08795.1 hypothetical protein F5544_04405 [Nocardia arthritidis]